VPGGPAPISALAFSARSGPRQRAPVDQATVRIIVPRPPAPGRLKGGSKFGANRDPRQNTPLPAPAAGPPQARCCSSVGCTRRAGGSRRHPEKRGFSGRKPPPFPRGRAEERWCGRSEGVAETISPRPALRPSEDKLGDGSAPRSLSRAGIRRPKGCQLPDAILHGKRSLRPHSRAVQRLALTGFRVRPLSPLGLVVAPPACGPGQDTSAISSPRLDPLLRVGHRLLAVRWPEATGLTSYLSGCLSLTGQRCRL